MTIGRAGNNQLIPKYREYKAKNPNAQERRTFNEAVKTAELSRASNAPEAKKTVDLPVTIEASKTSNVSEAKTNAEALNTSLKWFEGRELDLKTLNARMSAGIRVDIGRNEIAELMENIEKILANGGNFVDALQEQSAKHAFKFGVLDICDTFFINPNTGEVTQAFLFGSIISDKGELLYPPEFDDLAWDLAYDLQKFIQTVVFGKTNDLDEEEIKNLVVELKEKQAYKDNARFNGTYGYDENGGMRIQCRMGDTMYFGPGQTEYFPPSYVERYAENGGKISEEIGDFAVSYVEKTEDVIGAFIDVIGKHQDKLYEESKHSR